MRDALRNGIGPYAGGGIMRRRGGVAPVIVRSAYILSQPLVGVPVEVNAGEVTGATSTTYQWYEGDPGAGGTTVSGATSATMTPADAEYGSVLYRRATYSNAAGNTVADIAAPAVTGKTYYSDFAEFTIGNTMANIGAAGWAASSTGSFAMEIVADTTIASGKAMDWWGTANQTRNLWRSDWDTFSNSHSSDWSESLFLISHNTAARQGTPLRWHNGAGVTGTSLGAGPCIRFNNVYAQLPGDDPSATNGTLITALTVGQKYWFRTRVNGTSAKYKVWNSTLPEPAAWDVERTHGSALTTRGPNLGYRLGGASDKERCHFMSSGHLTAAPYPVGLELPAESSSDLMTYAASASATSVTQNDSTITYNFASAPKGRYCNGDPFLVNLAAGSGVSITSMTPASANVGGTRWSNGASLNMGEGETGRGPTTQGFDAYVPTAGLYLAYDGALNVDPGKTGSALAFAAGAEGSILKAVSNAANDPTITGGTDRIEFIGVLTVCAVEPPTNAFRPGVSAPSKVSHWLEDDLDMGLLRSLTAPSSAPSATNKLSTSRWPLMCWTTTSDPGRSVRGRTNHSDYGPNVGADTATAILLANCNIDSTVKRNIVVAEVQRGIDVYARALEGGSWVPGVGGTDNGRKLSLAFAAHMLGDAGMAAYCDPTIHAIWAEDQQTRYVTAADIAAYDHEAGDLGTPEWFGGPTIGSRAEAASYRAINTIFQPGTALAMMLIGGKTTWAHDPFFDYCDRIMARTFFNGSGTSAWATTLTGSNAPPTFHKDMWSSYRTTTGMPAVWNW